MLRANEGLHTRFTSVPASPCSAMPWARCAEGRAWGSSASGFATPNTSAGMPPTRIRSPRGSTDFTAAHASAASLAVSLTSAASNGAE